MEQRGDMVADAARFAPSMLASVGWIIGFKAFHDTTFNDPAFAGVIAGFNVAFALLILVTPLQYGASAVVKGSVLGAKLLPAILVAISALAALGAARDAATATTRVSLSAYELAPFIAAIGFGVGFVIYEIWHG